MEEKQSRRVSIKLRWGESLGRHCERELEAKPKAADVAPVADSSMLWLGLGAASVAKKL